MKSNDSTLIELKFQTIESLIEEFKSVPIENLLRDILLWRSKRVPETSAVGQHLAVIGTQADGKTVIEYYCAESQKWKYSKYINPFGSNYRAVAWNNEIFYIGAGIVAQRVPNLVKQIVSS